MKKIILFTMVAAIFSSLVFAKPVTIEWGDEYSVTIDLPDEIADLTADYMGDIIAALEENEITQEDVEDVLDEVQDEINDFYEEFKGDSDIDVAGPITTVENGLKDFSKTFGATIANNQLMQNVWAEAWAGQFLPDGFHIGGGVNVGASQLKLGSILDAIDALSGESISDELPRDFLFPTVAGDLRIGGIFLPFDIGFSLMTLDTSKIGALSDSSFAINFFTIGLDGRWALIDGSFILPKISVGGGFAYTKGGVKINEDDVSADIDFGTLNFYAQGQISKKLLFFIPFAGLKLGFASSKLAWKITPDWKSLFGEDIKVSIGDEQYSLFDDLNILPKSIGDTYKSFRFVPQIYGGFGLDFLVLNLTFTGGYDIVNTLWSASFNVRIAW